jgi:hypothetical protein
MILTRQSVALELRGTKSMAGLTKLQRDLRNVLLYTEELFGFKDRVVFDLGSEPHPSFHEVAVVGLEGIDVGSTSPTWASSILTSRWRKINEPLAQALLGRTMEEQIDVKIGKNTRWGIIELIEKSTSLAA